MNQSEHQANVCNGTECGKNVCEQITVGFGFGWKCHKFFLANHKSMLHEAIFLATCLATMTTEKHCKLQRGCHTFAIFFRNLQRPRWKLFTTLSLPAWNFLRAKDGLWLPNFHKIALQVAMDMSHAATCLATLRKVEDISTFLATHNATFCCLCRGCYMCNLSCNLSRNVRCETSCKKNCLV